MWPRVFLVLILCITALSVSACVTSHDYEAELTCEQFADNSHQSGDFVLEVGDKLRLELCSNQTTGYQWDYEFTTQNVVKEEDHDFQEPEEGVVGAAGVELWTFEAVGEGTTDIQMEYSQAWEGGSEAEWTYTVTVTVE
ncbi:MAG: protease inhibitor I42 family protein [Chloroflexota bacterium]|nr:protease inhibitor I42 family protein [Chloroflexota bacterium]